MQTIASELESIAVGDPSCFGSLTIFPLFRSGPARDPGYLLLDEAIAQGSARVTEVGGGSVPELRFENLGEQAVLLLDGEELMGAKQNRTVNLTILAPPKRSIVIPVSCVKAGRWHMQTPDFFAAGHVMYSRARAARAAQVTASMSAAGTRHSDQSAVWEEIAAKAERLGAASPTQAMAAMYDSRAVSIEAYLRAFSWTAGQAGALFAVGPRTFGLDLLDAPEAMGKLFPKLLKSYALDALEAPRSPVARKDEALEFLSRTAKGAVMAEPAVGMGKDVRLSAEGVSGAGLWAEERYVHICAFTTNGIGAPSGIHTNISRPSRRRDH